MPELLMLRAGFVERLSVGGEIKSLNPPLQLTRLNRAHVCI